MKTSGKSRFPEVNAGTVVRFAGDVAVSVAIVLGAAALVYAFTGAWPPVVAPEGESMEPAITTGSVLVVSGSSGLVGDASAGHGGVITHEQGKKTGYETFGDYGDVIVYRPGGSDSRRPILHRAMFYVEEGETYETKDGGTETAPHDGFVTKGDANPYYDQQKGVSVVKPGWVEGKAEYGLLRDTDTESLPVHAFEGITDLFGGRKAR
jgi:signal peptidase